MAQTTGDSLGKRQKAAHDLGDQTLGARNQIPPRLFENERLTDWPSSVDWTQELQEMLSQLRGYYGGKGFLFAEIDSVGKTDGSTSNYQIFVITGSKLRLDSLDVRTDSDWDLSDFKQTMKTREGKSFVPSDLDTDLEDLLQYLTSKGAVQTSVAVDQITVSDDSSSVSIEIAAARTSVPVISGIRINDDSRTNPRLIGRIAELDVGKPMVDFDPDRIQNRLEATDFIETAGKPQLLIDGNNEVVVFIPIEDAAPGTFDLVLGYLPSTGAQSSGTIVGSGKIDLSNIFGGGRNFGLTLNRLPGQVASVKAHAADPFVAGWPIGLEFSFDGYQQDSTYARQSFAVGTSYLIASGLRGTFSVTREITRPGQSGLAIISGEQRIPRASAYFVGVGVRYRNLDFAPNPRSGVLVEMNLERGRSSRESAFVSEGDTTRKSLNLSQQRLRVSARLILPTVTRQAVVIGTDAVGMISNEYRDSDLFRFGGASTLRGYNEEQFAGNFVGRIVGEYRYQIDRTSYAFVFADAGFVQVPEFDETEESRTFHPGFGLGIQFETAIGFVNATYALNNIDGPANGRIHIGLSFGL